MDTIFQVFSPEFPLRNSVFMSLLIGVACPMVGVYLVLRRLVFMGVALPQVSSCGIAAAFALHTWHIIPHIEESSEHLLAISGSTVFTVVAIGFLALLERRGRGSTDGRLGTVYALAGAWSILLLVKNPFGEHGLLDRLKGELIAVSEGDLILTTATFGIVAAALILFRKEFMLVSFDRDMAVSLRKNVLGWDALLFLLIGLTISMSVLSVGPLVTFGFLLLPALTAHLLAGTMRQFAVMASAIGGVVALAGFLASYKWDLPAGPTDVALLGFVYTMAFVGRHLIVRWRAPQSR